jgi:hypothetical protein
MENEKFAYESVEVTRKGPKKTVRKVSIKNGKGYKSVSKYVRGKHVGTSRKQIDDTHIPLIKGGSFITGFFSDCKCESSKTRKNKNKNKNKK